MIMSFDNLPITLSYKQVSDVLGIKETTLRQWVARDHPDCPTYFKLGARVLFNREALKAFYFKKAGIRPDLAA